LLFTSDLNRLVKTRFGFRPRRQTVAVRVHHQLALEAVQFRLVECLLRPLYYPKRLGEGGQPFIDLPHFPVGFR
jgi:hypothetical protein